jgi:hypothetical protein
MSSHVFNIKKVKARFEGLGGVVLEGVALQGADWDAACFIFLQKGFIK